MSLIKHAVSFAGITLIALTTGCATNNDKPAAPVEPVPVFVENLYDDNLKPRAIIKQKLNADGQTLIIDASSSIAPENAHITYHWELTNQPVNSVTFLRNSEGPAQSLFIDKDGQYSISLQIEVDGKKSQARDLIFNFPNAKSKTLISNIKSEN